MPALLLAFAGMLSSVAGTLVGRVLLSLGISFVTYKGMDLIFDGLKSAINNNLTGLPGDISGMISAVGITQAISIIFGAITARVTLAGIRGGSFTRMLAK